MVGPPLAMKKHKNPVFALTGLRHFLFNSLFSSSENSFFYVFFFKGTVAWEGFLVYSFPSCGIGCVEKFSEFGLLFTKVGRDFAHLALEEIRQTCECAFSYCAQCIFSCKRGPREKLKCVLQWQLLYIFTGSLQSCIFLPRLLHSLSALGECVERR